mgnify:CR=1 FL=1
MGNALIIQEDAWISSCVPNDCRGGGNIKFKFDKRVILKKLVLADNDERMRPTISFTKANGEIVTLPAITAGADGSVAEIIFDSDATNVKELNVNLKGSGGIPLLMYQECNGGGFGDPHFRTHSGKATRLFV